MSTDEDVAAATVDNVGVVTVTAIKRGSAVITVTAEGPTAASSTLTRSVSAPATRQNIAEYSFMVNVANRAPTVKATISAQTLPVGESTESEDLGEYFEDPDDDVLTYTSTSSNTNVAIAVVNGTFGTVVAVAVGTATITVTARDPDPGGLSVTQTFMVTVSAVSAPEPDLISSISVSDSTLTTGATFTLRATVSNRGTGSSAATTLTYYRSSDSTITTGDTPIGTQSVSALDATSGAGREPISLIAPSSEGTYYYGACVDSVLGESDTTNNCSTAVTVTVVDPPTSAPDLIISARSVSNPSPETSASFTLSATVQNRGTDSSTVTTLRYYLSSDSTIKTSDIPVGIKIDGVSALAASETSPELSTPLTAPNLAGTYYYGACVDLVSRESDTTNNCSTAVTVTVELPVAANQPPTAINTIAAVILSEGDSAVTRDVLAYFRDPEGGVLTYTVSSSAPGVATAGVSGSVVTVMPVAAGNATITVTAEDPGRLSATQDIAVTVVTNQPLSAPDLVISAVSVSDSTLITATSFTLRATVLNQGGASSSETTLRYYRSSDSTISRSDTFVGSDTVSTLAASATSPASISLTAPSSSGTYYYGVCVDSVLGESDMTNNCSTAVTVNVEAPPRPIISGSSVSPATVTIGDSFTFSVTVRNPGNSESSSATLRYYISTDSSISTGDTQLGTDTVNPLPASGTSTESISTRAKSVGTYYLGACLDSCSTTVQLIVAAPDLIISSSSANPSTVTTGNAFTFHATVHNQGGGRASSTGLMYYRSTDLNIPTDDTLLGTDTVDVLPASATAPKSISLSAPDSAGTYYYGACVSPVPGESDRNNNCSTAVTVTVEEPLAPDLIISARASDSYLTEGGSFTLSAVVRNQGTEAAASTTLKYYRSLDSTISNGDFQIGTDDVKALAGSEISTESIPLSAQHFVGTYYYGACVDSVATEETTSNNCSTGVAVVVTVPDLVISSVSASDSSLTAGGSFTLSVEVHNQGAVASTPTILRYSHWHSGDRSSAPGDTTVSIPAVAGFATSSVSLFLSAPRLDGHHYYTVCVDSVTYETATDNNCSLSVSVVVTVPVPDLAVTLVSDPSSVKQGASFTLSAVVRNQGDVAAALTSLEYSYYYDSRRRVVGTNAVESLAASSTGSFSISVSAPSTPGTYTYRACVEVATTVDTMFLEKERTNNCAYASVLVTHPDLVVSISTPDSAQAEDTFTLMATVSNIGTEEAPSTTLKVYRAAVPRSTLLSITSVDTLAPSATSSVSVPVLAIPGRRGATQYYEYFACVESVPGERNKRGANNCSNRTRVRSVAQ